MAAHPTPPLPSSVISINVNGLRDARKRQHLFACLLDGPWQLILLQETHTANDEEVQQWMQEGAGPGRPWQGLGFWGHSGNQRSRGVAVLIHHRSRDSLGKGPGTPSVQYSATDGRAIRVEWGPVGQRVAAISAYAPSLPAERPAYFQQNGTLAAALQAGIGATAQLLVGGDFNCVMDQRDIIGPHTQGGGSRMVGSQELQDLMAAHGLIDAWRAIHPFTQEATHAATTNTSHARLDMLFMPPLQTPVMHVLTCYSCQQPSSNKGGSTTVAITSSSRWGTMPLSLLNSPTQATPWRGREFGISHWHYCRTQPSWGN